MNIHEKDTTVLYIYYTDCNYSLYSLVALISMMASAVIFCRSTNSVCCVDASITLLGIVDDWKLLRSKVDRLLEFDTKNGLMKK